MDTSTNNMIVSQSTSSLASSTGTAVAPSAGLDQTTKILIGAIIAGCVLVTILLLVFFFVRRRRRRDVDDIAGTPERPPSPGIDVLHDAGEREPQRYTTAPPLNDADVSIGHYATRLPENTQKVGYDVVIDN